MSGVDEILKERPSKHGEFEENARCTWSIMAALQGERNWPTLTSDKRHALYMVAHKMARIVCGDPKEPDHWVDIEGYAKCVSDRLATPVKVYDPDRDIYGALAVAWGVDRETAKSRILSMQYQQGKERRASQESAAVETMKRDLLGSPGTPEDGGQHGRSGENPSAAGEG